MPDAKTLIRLAQLLDEPVLKDLLAQRVTLGRTRRVIHGRRLRVDTTVVETNIHYPTDATLLADGVRVLTRGWWGSASTCGSARVVSPDGCSRSRSAVAPPATEPPRQSATKAKRA